MSFHFLSFAFPFPFLSILQEELSTADQSIITIPVIPEGTTDSTHPKIDLVVTREEFETAVKPITDLVEATVYHTLQSWQQQQKQQENEVHGEQEKDAAPAEEEEVDGFVRVSEASNSADVTANAVADHNQGVETIASRAPSGTIAKDASVEVEVIDEVVLVGGSSRVPCVRAALRRALGKAGISAFAPNGPKELCTSLNPEEVVAEGLAVRGAVLSGVSTGKLKELLMMDCVNNAIGVMTWEVEAMGDTTSGAGSVSTFAKTRIFNSVLHKGMSIPAKNTLRFPLADANQRFVSLDIFEEVEEVKRKKEITNSANSTHSGDASDFEITYAYNVVATADIAIPSSLATAHDSDAVDITFTMTMDGVLQFNVVRVSGPSSGDSGTANINTSSVNMLIGYIVLMFALYLFVKIVLTEAEVSSAIDSSFVNNVVAGAEHVCDSVSAVVDGQVQKLNNAVVDAVGGLHV